MLLVLALGWATLQTARFLLSPLLPRIIDTFGFSPGGIGLVLTVFGLLYAAVQYPSGTYSDELSRATLLVPGFLVLLVAVAVIGLSVTPWLFVLGVVVLGIGKGLYASPSRALLGDLFDSSRGRALGIYTAGTDVGGLVASGLAVAVLATTVWRAAFLPVFLVLVAVMVLFVLWNREPYALHRVRLDPAGTAGRIAETREQREVIVAFFIFYFFVGGLINFFPTLLVDSGLSEAIAGAVFALLFAVGIVTKPLAGDVSDRYSRLLVSIVGLLLAVVGVAVVLLATTLPVVALGTVLAAVGYKTQFPIADTVVMEAAPDGHVGGDLGAARAVFLAGNAVGPGFVGIVAQVSSFQVAFWLLAASLLVSIGILVRQYRRQ